MKQSASFYKETVSAPGEGEMEIDLMECIRTGLVHWYWFVVSVAVCCILGAAYILFTPPQYSRGASVMIKDESSGGGINETALFEDINLFGNKYNVNNELEVLRSRRLMEEVVRRLRLDVNYRMRKHFYKEDLYVQSPVTVIFPDMEETETAFLKVVPIDAERVKLYGFRREGLKNKRLEIVAGLHDTVATPLGKVAVTPTLYYSSGYYGCVIEVAKAATEETAKDILRRLTAALADKNTTVVNLKFTDRSVLRADDLLNTLILVYNQDWIKDKNRVAVNTSRFINDRLMIIEKELGSVDSDIERFKSKNLLTDLQAMAEMYINESSEYTSKVLELENQLSVARYIREYLNDPGKDTELIPANSGLDELNINSQINEYNALLLKRDRLLSNSSPRNPVVEHLNYSLSALRQSVIRGVDNLIASLQVQISNIRGKESQVSRQIAVAPGQEKYMLSVERQQKIKESLYLYLLQKREENELAVTITASNMRIVEPAGGDSFPVAPRKKIILAMAVFLGLCIPAGLLFLREMLDTTVKGKKDIEQVITAPFLGEIPHVREINEKGRKKRYAGDEIDIEEKINSKKVRDTPEKKAPVLVGEYKRDAVNEAFRVVRSNMSFMNTNRHPSKLILFTSFHPGSGKTFTCLNLAVSFALSGKKVALVDLDLRKATLSASVPAARQGISSFLSGLLQEPGSLAVKGIYHKNLDIFPVGVIPPNPSELMLGPYFQVLMEELRSSYDYVFLDCTPLNLVADASIAGKEADLVLFVIREGLFDRRMLPEVENIYREGRFKSMAVLLNDSGVLNGYYEYGLRYAYGYGHGYGWRRGIKSWIININKIRKV